MLNLNQNAISQANNASMFEAGSVLAREAERVYASGLQQMQAPFEGKEPTEQQAAILAAREASFRDLVEKAYNEMISRRASWVPWTVSGPANYPAQKMNRKADKAMEVASEWSAKISRFIDNTLDMLRDAVPQEQILAEYRSGKRRDSISGDDPAALAKLQARLEGMQERHGLKKKINAWWRKHQTMKGCPDISEKTAREIDEQMKQPYRHDVPFPSFSLSNGNQEIHRIEDRIKALQRSQAAGDARQEYTGFTVETAGQRLNIIFDGKPEEAARQILKENAFHWSPRAKVWTRQLTENARRALRLYVLPGLQALPEYAPQEPQEAPQQTQEAPQTMTLAEFISAASAAE